VPVSQARQYRILPFAPATGVCLAIASLGILFAVDGLQNAVANGDTRTLTFHHTHRDDDLTITFKRNGRYDDEALKKLNYFLRDWRTDETTQMDPHLFDILWEVYREVGGKEPINIISSYRSPHTNAMLRRRGRGVARFSQHMLGKAMDFYIPGVALDQIRAAGLRLQRGGVGFYPTSGSPFVHVDTGSVRHWPRMTHDQLARIFPDGKTVHVPSDGQPLRNHALAMAELERRGPNSAGATPAKRNFFAKLLGIGSGDEDEGEGKTARPERVASAVPTSPPAARPEALANVPMPRARPQRATEYALASATIVTPTRAPAAPPPPGTPADIVNSRGIWGGVQPAEPPPRPPAPIGSTAAEADAPDTRTSGGRFAWLTGRQAEAQPRRPAENAVEPNWPDAIGQTDRVPTELMLAYAANAGPDPAVRPAAYPMGPQRPNALIATKSPPAVPAMRPGHRGDDPWLRGIVIAPSVHYSMSVAVFGGTDPRSIRPYMLKPRWSVHMVFSHDPQFGLASEYFSGSAIAFLPTVSFVRTAGIN
jgi:uncharacterized protein YcbK (DUF882 family)